MNRASGVTVDGCGVRMADPGRVEAARAALAGTAALADAAEVFSLLGDPTRLSLLACLLEIGEMCVCDLAAATGQSESAVSHALRLLRARRVVEVRRDGRRAFYRLADSHVRMLLDVTVAHAGHTAAVVVHDAGR